MILACGCNCGSTENLIRNFLYRSGYKDWATMPIHKGKEASRRMLNGVPPSDETDRLDKFIGDNSSYAVILGYDDTHVRWADIAHGGKDQSSAKVILDLFA